MCISPGGVELSVKPACVSGANTDWGMHCNIDSASKRLTSIPGCACHDAKCPSPRNIYSSALSPGCGRFAPLPGVMSYFASLEAVMCGGWWVCVAERGCGRPQGPRPAVGVVYGGLLLNVGADGHKGRTRQGMSLLQISNLRSQIAVSTLPHCLPVGKSLFLLGF